MNDQQQHPAIAPPPELVQQWIGEYAAHHPELPEQVYIATRAAQWGYEQRGDTTPTETQQQ